MAKKGREKVKLVSSANTGYFFSTTKNKKKTVDKLEMNSYDPIVRKHVLFKEGK